MSDNCVVSGVVASAGAKVLITGGYLVLENPNTGIVLSVDSRLHTGVYSLEGTNVTSKINPDSSISVPIYVLTPQLSTSPLVLTLTLKYVADSLPDCASPFHIEITGATDKNSFVSKSLHTCLVAISAVLSPAPFLARVNKGLLIHVRGDRPFYSSTPLPATNVAPQSDNLTLEPEIVDDPADYQTKTGLGSSAAVVSSLVAAVFAYFSLWTSPHHGSAASYPAAVDFHHYLSPADARLLAYRVAQFAHCAAQGKVGSGFDVAAAFHGTQTYCRFSASLIQQLLDHPAEVAEPVLASGTQAAATHPYTSPSTALPLLRVLLPTLSTWDDVTTPFQLPPGLRLLLGDVRGGSETPSMVKKILQWRRERAAAVAAGEVADVWSELAQANARVEADFVALSSLAAQHPELFQECVRMCARLPVQQWAAEDTLNAVTISVDDVDERDVQAVLETLVQLSSNFSAVRALLRAMGEGADVPVEPPTQTQLLDGTSALPGVVMAGVPGAGGYDAVFALVLEDGSGIASDGVLSYWRAQQSPVNTEDAANQGGIMRLPVDIDRVQGVSVRRAHMRVSDDVQRLIDACDVALNATPVPTPVPTPAPSPTHREAPATEAACPEVCEVARAGSDACVDAVPQSPAVAEAAPEATTVVVTEVVADVATKAVSSDKPCSAASNPSQWLTGRVGQWVLCVGVALSAWGLYRATRK